MQIVRRELMLRLFEKNNMYLFCLRFEATKSVTV